VLQSIFVFQEKLGHTRGKAPRGSARQDAEQRTAGGNPPQRLLQALGAEAMADQIADRESAESAIPVEIGAQNRAGGPDAGIGERLLKPRLRQVDHGDRVADQRQRRTHILERLQVVGDGEVASLPA